MNKQLQAADKGWSLARMLGWRLRTFHRMSGLLWTFGLQKIRIMPVVAEPLLE